MVEESSKLDEQFDGLILLQLSAGGDSQNFVIRIEAEFRITSHVDALDSQIFAMQDYLVSWGENLRVDGHGAAEIGLWLRQIGHDFQRVFDRFGVRRQPVHPHFVSIARDYT